MNKSFVAEIELQNYRSFARARCKLRPFTLAVGANNAGKSNLLSVFRFMPEFIGSDMTSQGLREGNIPRHVAHKEERSELRLIRSDGAVYLESDVIVDPEEAARFFHNVKKLLELEAHDKLRQTKLPERWQLRETPPIFRLAPARIGGPEQDQDAAFVFSSGEGTTRVLKALKLGANEERFVAIEKAFTQCVPEVSKLSFYKVESDKWAIQVSEVGLPEPVPLSQLSDGSRLILAILTIIYQQNPPEIILLEDIDRGIHPRLYENLVRQMREITRTHGVQIIATTHSPYLLDEFQDEPEAVVIVEKVNGESRLSNLSERLKEKFGETEEPEMPLGELWFSGALGGVPKRKLPSLPKP